MVAKVTENMEAKYAVKHGWGLEKEGKENIKFKKENYLKLIIC